MYGEAQTVPPVHPIPPHWPYSGTVVPPDAEVVAVVVAGGGVVVDRGGVVVVPLLGAVDVGPDDPLPPVQTAGPGIV